MIEQILERTGAQDGDLIFFGADKAKVVNDALGALRLKIGHERGLAEAGWRPLWVLDFPMFEWDEEAKRWNAMHHPFTAPADGHEDLLETDPGAARAKAHDIVLNGWEIGGGSIRIHRQDVQSKVFRALNISAEEAEAKFGFLLQALQYGAPPHGGIAFGLDRMVTLMAGAESIRDVIAFPEDAARAGPAHARAEHGRRAAAARAAHPAAAAGSEEGLSGRRAMRTAPRLARSRWRWRVARGARRRGARSRRSARRERGTTRAAVAVVALAELPPEARHTLRAHPRRRTFSVRARRRRLRQLRAPAAAARARLLPRIHRARRPGVRHRGARRIVAGRGGELYYTDDHYRSFRRIRE